MDTEDGSGDGISPVTGLPAARLGSGPMTPDDVHDVDDLPPLELLRRRLGGPDLAEELILDRRREAAEDDGDAGRVL